jgi:hypothetical protein
MAPKALDKQVVWLGKRVCCHRLHENLFHTNAENEDVKSPELDKVRGARRMFRFFGS